MVFCGQCGLQLFPGAVHCPRCGAAVDADTGGATIEDLHANDPTVASVRVTQNPSPPLYGPTGSAMNQPPMVLRDNAGRAYNTQGVYEAATGRDTPLYTPHPPVSPITQDRGAYADYTPPPNALYPAPNASYSTFSAPNTPGYPVTVGSHRPERPAHGPGRSIALLVILCGLLLILGSMVLLAIRHNVLPTHTGNTSNSITAVATFTPAQHARTTLLDYYRDINQHDYQAAYNLWKDYPTSFDQFKAGFAHTLHDDLTIGKITPQNDGTQQALVTLRAADSTPSGTQYRTYQGYYIIGQFNGRWLLFNGHLDPVTA
jgi:hypothetical protein